MRRLLTFAVVLLCAAVPASAATTHHRHQAVTCHRNAHHKRVCVKVHRKKHTATPPKTVTAMPTPTAPVATAPAPAAPAPVAPAPAPAAGTTATTTTTAPASPTPPALPSRTGVELREYSVLPTRNPLAAGTVTLDVTNYGEDDHDLTVADASGTVLGSTGVISPQGTGSLTLTLPAGQYKLFCSLFKGAHDRMGMHATLTVQ